MHGKQMRHTKRVVLCDVLKSTKQVISRVDERRYIEHESEYSNIERKAEGLYSGFCRLKSQ